MQTDWYESFFHGLALDFWRRAVSAEQTEAEVRFMETEFNVPPGSRILDVPCGNGRHSVEMAKRGYAMTAVDLSEEFVAELKQAAVHQNVQVEVVHADMRFLPLDR